MTRSEVLSHYMSKKLEFWRKMHFQTALEFYEGWIVSSKPPLFSGKFIKETYHMNETLWKPLSFSEQWRFCMPYPKNDSFCQNLWRHRTWHHRWIGHSKWKSSSCSIWYQAPLEMICSRFISAKYCHFLSIRPGIQSWIEFLSQTELLWMAF